MNPKFSNLEELKNRIMPALDIRVRELKKENIYTNSEELWNYFARKWRKTNNLTLSDVVNDVLNEEIKIKEEVIS